MNPGIDTTEPIRNDERGFNAQFSASQLVASMASESDILDIVMAGTDPESEEEQTSFALTVEQFLESEYGPSKRFLRSLVRKYICKIGEQNVQSEPLLNLLLRVLQQDQDIPNPNQSCYASFPIPLQENHVSCSKREEQLSVRIFPYHNDVALRIWEAGATLAEYVLQNPELVAHRRVVELGAGVGLTSLVIATCQATHVYCTDFTEICLQNIDHNIETNEALLKRYNTEEDCISCGYLEWEAFGDFQEKSDPRLQKSCEMIARANLLIAADVIYDVSAIPGLVKTFKRFFLEKDTNDHKEVILASTMRRRETFAVLQEELKKEGMFCRLKVDGNYCARLRIAFPMNFVQPRKDVSIYALSMGKR